MAIPKQTKTPDPKPTETESGCTQVVGTESATRPETTQVNVADAINQSALCTRDYGKKWIPYLAQKSKE